MMRKREYYFNDEYRFEAAFGITTWITYYRGEINSIKKIWLSFLLLGILTDFNGTVYYFEFRADIFVTQHDPLIVSIEYMIVLEQTRSFMIYLISCVFQYILKRTTKYILILELIIMNISLFYNVI